MSPPPPSAAPTGPSRTLLVVAAVVVGALVVGAIVAGVLSGGGDDDPVPVGGGSTAASGSAAPTPTSPGAPSPSPSPSPSPAGELAPAYDTVVSLQQISTDFGASWAALRDLYLAETIDGSEVEEAKTTYGADRSAYVGAVMTLGDRVAGADPATAAAYDEFRADALGTIGYLDDALELSRTRTVCFATLKLGLLDKPAHQKSAKQCRREAAPLLDSQAPGLVAYAKGWRTLMQRRIKGFDSVRTSDDFFARGADVITALGEDFDRFKPVLEAAPTALKTAADASVVTQSYPALLRLIATATGVK